MARSLLQQVGTRVANQLGDPPAYVDVDALINEFDEATQELLREQIAERERFIMEFEIVFGASPMSNTPAAAMSLVDFDRDDGRHVLTSPGDLGIDLPMTAFGLTTLAPNEVSDLAATVWRRSARRAELPVARTIHDRIYVDEIVERRFLEQAVTDLITDEIYPVDYMSTVIQRVTGGSQELLAELSPRELALRYLDAVLVYR